MRMVKYEFAKLIKNPFIWLVLVTFLAFNVLLIYGYVGNDYDRQELADMHDTVIQYGVDLNEDKNLDKSDEYTEFYKEYIEQYGLLYDNLDMMDVLKRKEEMSGYHPTGEYADFIKENYEKLQERVKEIKKSGEGDYGFYPGMVYEIHRILYSKIGEKLLLEMAIIVMLSILYIMDYERIHKTRDIVLVTKSGKKVMQKKAMAGLCMGLIYSILLMVGTYIYFFCNVSFQGLWNVPVTSTIMAEQRNQMLYPFVTFWNLTEVHYFVLTIIVFIGLLLIIGGITIAFQLLLQNSYFAFLVECLLYMGLCLFVYFHTETFWDVIRLIFNPVSLWVTCGGWFMENDLSLSFAGNEFWILGCSAIVVIIMILLGRVRYKKLEIK